MHVSCLSTDGGLRRSHQEQRYHLGCPAVQSPGDRFRTIGFGIHSSRMRQCGTELKKRDRLAMGHQTGLSRNGYHCTLPIVQHEAACEVGLHHAPRQLHPMRLTSRPVTSIDGHSSPRRLVTRPSSRMVGRMRLFPPGECAIPCTHSTPSVDTKHL